MKKEELVNKIAKETSFTKKDTEIFLAALMSAIQETVKSNQKVTLVGFGTFEQRARAARKGRNPKTQEVINIPATKAPVFRAGTEFKKIVNGKKIEKKKNTKPVAKKKKK